MQIKIRDARDEDAPGIIDLIAGCYADYDGCVLDVDGEAPELNSIATAHRTAGGRFWVAESEGRIVGSIGFIPDGNGGVEMKKLYVSRDARKMGLGAHLCSLLEAEARSRHASAVALWSDTRFEDAHRLYERRGYERGPKTRELKDKSKSVEYFFRKVL
jgi:putative acetyltransferase